VIKSYLHLIKPSPQAVVFFIDPVEMVMENGDLQAFGFILFFKALGVLVEEVDSLLIMFVRHKYNDIHKQVMLR
jgi:hypothetical protein